MAKRDPKLARSRLEALLSMATGTVAEPVAGLSGLYGLLTGGADRGARNVEQTREALTYAPMDSRGASELAQFVSPVTSRIEQGKRYLGDNTLRMTGSPGLAAAAYTAPEILATLAGARGAGIKGPTMQQMAQRTAELPTMGSPASQAGNIGHWLASPAASRMTREQFLGSPKITKNANAADLKPKALSFLDSAPAEPISVGGSTFTAKYSPDGAAIFDGDKVVASYNFGDTLVVDKAYRKMGIGSELVYEWRTRFPAPANTKYRTKASQAIQERVWDRIQREGRR